MFNQKRAKDKFLSCTKYVSQYMSLGVRPLRKTFKFFDKTSKTSYLYLYLYISMLLN